MGNDVLTLAQSPLLLRRRFYRTVYLFSRCTVTSYTFVSPRAVSLYLWDGYLENIPKPVSWIYAETIDRDWKLSKKLSLQTEIIIFTLTVWDLRWRYRDYKCLSRNIKFWHYHPRLSDHIIHCFL